ncbi:polysaccharide lyase 6 family protein [Aurantiacibacter sp. MUD61]|uniref:polysaccharide lyase 6 family protein n=1 Tax=Aurantiacibacter sp. MUD61 TaxID=3009083 RepID=UPI0022F00EC1|nr:polysaccharide lyase 6 family protein [Aurantiacibacter sp. MUD61]
MFGRLAIIAAGALAWVTPAQAEDFFVSTQAEYADAARGVEAGDTIILANGEWHDFEMVITGAGQQDALITVTAETPGQVILTGQSNLRIGGQYVVVSGLVFRDGYSPTGEVISFRRDSDDLASNARVTQTVIDGFSKPDRNETDYWVAMFGSDNRFDHNHLVGKTNRGVTLAVRLNTEESRGNNHHIDHNYFGPRPVLGSNGGETLRIGTSHYSMFDSNTLVENNVFDRTSGEVEIISIKSGANIVRGNLFLRSQGALTLRHGDGNLIERNVFLGHGVDHTGGIRIINRNQTVRENYMEGLRGAGFASALTVMNGVPNSPVNRYVVVDNALIENNTVVDSFRITLGAGADEERSANPVNSSMTGNLFAGSHRDTFIEVDADMSGIVFTGNALVSGRVHSAIADELPVIETEMVRRENGLLYPASPELENVGAPRDLQVISLSDVGVEWYSKPGQDGMFGAGQEIAVHGSGEALISALSQAGNGDTFRLAPGDYHFDRTLPIDRPVTLLASDGEEVVLRFTRPSLFELREGGALRLDGVIIDGSLAPDNVGNAVIRTGSAPIRGNLQIELENVEVRNLTVNRDFDVIYLGPSTLAERLLIRGSQFSGISGTVVSAASEHDDQGRYNVDYMTIENSAFANVVGPVAEVYRGGRDESTFGPHVLITNSQFSNVGSGADASIVLHGVQDTLIAENQFAASAPISVVHTVGVPQSAIWNNEFAETPRPSLAELVFPGQPRVSLVDNSFDGVVE